MLTQQEIDRRVARAEELFARGFNCSQAVVAACADLYGVDSDIALRVSASFGGGIARMRYTCGAACGMFILAGLEKGNTQPDQPQRKLPNYEFVRSLADDFRQRHGSLVCAELLGLNGESPKQKMPCKKMIGEAVRQYLEKVKAENK